MHGFPPHFLRNWPLIRTHSHITAQARRYKVFAALTVGSVQRMLLEALQRLFIPQFCIEYQVIVPSGQVEAFQCTASRRSCPAWWQRNFVKTSKLRLLDAVLLQRRYISRTKYGGSSQLPLFRRFLFLNYTIPPGKKHAVEPDIPGEQNAAVFGSFSTCVLLSFLVD